MGIGDILAEVEFYMGEMEKRPEDKHVLWLELRNRLNQMRAMSMPVPEDLARFEAELEAEFEAERAAAVDPSEVSKTEPLS
jgi:hypothetical protein